MSNKNTNKMNYPPVQQWARAPHEFEWVKLQTGEVLFVEKNKQRFVLKFHKELKIHPFIKGADLQGILVRRDSYPPVGSWSSAPDEFRWLNLELQNGDYTIQNSDDNLEVYIIAKWHGILKAHLRILFAEMPENFRRVRKEKYPPLEEWRLYRNQSLPLKNGEYTLVVNPRSGVPTRIIAWHKGCLVNYPYQDYARFNDNEKLRFVPLEDVKKR